MRRLAWGAPESQRVLSHQKIYHSVSGRPSVLLKFLPIICSVRRRQLLRRLPADCWGHGKPAEARTSHSSRDADGVAQAIAERSGFPAGEVDGTFAQTTSVDIVPVWRSVRIPVQRVFSFSSLSIVYLPTCV